MSNKVEFFMLTFVDKNAKNDGEYYKGDFKKFFDDLENIFNRKDKIKIMLRTINNKGITTSRFKRNNSNYISIPFGKLKEGKTFHMDDDVLKELNTELFEVTSLVLNETNNVAIISKNRMGPNYQLIEEYLNTFLPKNFMYQIKIIPLIEDRGLDRLKEAEYVKKVIFELNIGDIINREYINNLKSKNGSIKSFVQFSANDLASKRITVDLGFRYGKKTDSLDIECVKKLIEDLQLNDEIVEQIKLEFTNNIGKKDYALFKDSNIIVDHVFNISDNYLASEYLLNHCEEAFEIESCRYRSSMISVKSAEKNLPQTIKELRLDWNDKDYYNE